MGNTGVRTTIHEVTYMSLSTSLAEARQLYSTLSDIEQQLETVESKTKQTTVSYADLYNVLQDIFIITKRMGLPEEAEELLNYIQRLIALANSLRIAFIALHAASGPVGWLIAGLGLTTSLIYATDTFGRYG